MHQYHTRVQQSIQDLYSIVWPWYDTSKFPRQVRQTTRPAQPCIQGMILYWMHYETQLPVCPLRPNILHLSENTVNRILRIHKKGATGECYHN